MTAAFLEHVNFTVADPVKTAANLCNWFGWHVRWQGPAIHDGLTYHVGNDPFMLKRSSEPRISRCNMTGRCFSPSSPI